MATDVRKLAERSQVAGAVNLWGSVIDLAVRFGLPKSASTRRNCIVVVEATSKASGR